MPLRLRKARSVRIGRQKWQHLNWHSVPLAGSQGFRDGLVDVFDGDGVWEGRSDEEMFWLV
jgi:hypothetical protein